MIVTLLLLSLSENETLGLDRIRLRHSFWDGKILFFFFFFFFFLFKRGFLERFIVWELESMTSWMIGDGDIASIVQFSLSLVFFKITIKLGRLAVIPTGAIASSNWERCVSFL